MAPAAPDGAREGYLAQFTEPTGYLDFARYGPPSRAVVAETTAALTASAEAGPTTVNELMESDARARGAVSRLTGFGPDAVTVVPNTSTGLFQAAFALPGGADGPAEVLVSADEFPSNIYPWARAQEAGRAALELTRMPDRRVTPAAVRAALTPRTTAVSVSAVDFRTGYRADLAGIREAIGDRLLIVDGIQGFGVIDAPWQAADILIAGGQKWLRASWATGFLALSDRALERVEPVLSGWTGVQDPVRYDGELHPRAAGAQSFSVTNLSPITTAAFAAALELVESVGAAWIGERISERVDELATAVESVGGRVLSPREPAERAGIITFTVPGHTPAQVGATLTRHGVSVTVHADQVRLSPHASTSSDAARIVHQALRTLTAHK